ncbi:MAG: DNA primase, partial [Runella slithyformis]
MIAPKQIAQIKAVSIIDYLQSIGHNPVKESSGQLVYFSPKSTEANPSFFVNPTKNVFADFSGAGGKGDVIS